MSSSADARRAVWRIAFAQQGYFTAGQAQEVGWTLRALVYQAQVGEIERIHRGVYRLAGYPESSSDVMAAFLAVGQRIGREKVTVSHESALELYDVCEIDPHRIHLTVPRVRRAVATPTSTVQLHATQLPLEGEVVERNGLRLTRELRTLLDCAQLGTAGDQLEAAIRSWLRSGRLTAERIQRAAAERGGIAQERLLPLLQAV